MPVFNANLFYSTGILMCILVLKKCKKAVNVPFFNTAEYFDKGQRHNQLTQGCGGKAEARRVPSRARFKPVVIAIAIERIAASAHIHWLAALNEW